MKPHFAKMKCVEFMLFLLSFGAFINAQSEEPSESTKLLNTTSIASLKPSVLVGVGKSSVGSVQPRATSQMNSEKTQAAVTHQNTISVKATRTFSNSSITALYSTSVPPTTAAMRGRDSKLGLIIGCCLLFVVCVLIMLLFCLRFCRRRRRPMQVGSIHLSDDSWRIKRRAPLCGRSLPIAGLRGYGLSAKGSIWKTVSYSNIAVDDTGVIFSKEILSENTSDGPGLPKEMITTKGGVIQIDDIILKIGAGSLTKDTEITLIKDDQNYDFESLLKLGLLDAAPRVVEFLPDGLKFLKPADLRIRFEKSVKDSELFVLHGWYNREYQRRVWELVTNDITENSVEGFVDMKIHGFSFYSYILSRRNRLARILSHLNKSFSCGAYVLYRRFPSTPTIDIAVVLVSEFVENDGEIKQLKRLLENGYKEGTVEGGTGSIKRVYTDRSLEMFVDFPDVEASGFQFKIDLVLLDSVGYVVDHFMGIAIEKPANGAVLINEIKRGLERESLWTLNIREVEEEIRVETEQGKLTDLETRLD